MQRDIGVSTGVFHPHTTLKDALAIFADLDIAAALMFPGRIIIESQLRIDDLAAELVYIREHVQ